MANIKLPMVNEQFSAQFSKDALVLAKKFKTNYGTIFKEASNSTGVPVDIGVGFMIIENPGGDPAAKSYTCTAKKDATGDCYVGMMQMGAETAFDTMKRQAPDLDPKEAAIIQKYLPGFIKPGGFVGFLSSWKMKIYKALQNPEFSIWIGMMHIGQLMKTTKDKDGNFRFDHVIVKYNRGVGNFQKEVVKTGLQNADTATLAQKLPVAETRAYILKFVGKDGSVIQSMRTKI